MAWSRLASASSERKPNESARATSPGMGGMSASLSTAAGARFCADVRSRTAAAKASANPRAAALLRNAVVTAPMIASARSPTQKRSGGGPLPATPPLLVANFLYRFTSFRSFAGSPDGLFASAVQLPPVVNTRESLAMLHWSIVASASMLPCAVATKFGVGGAVTPAALLQAVAAYAWLKVLPYLNVSTWIPV